MEQNYYEESYLYENVSGQVSIKNRATSSFDAVFISSSVITFL